MYVDYDKSGEDCRERAPVDRSARAAQLCIQQLYTQKFYEIGPWPRNDRTLQAVAFAMTGTEVFLRVDWILLEHLDQHVSDILLRTARKFRVILFVARRRRREHDVVAVWQTRLTVGREVVLKSFFLYEKRRVAVDRFCQLISFHKRKYCKTYFHVSHKDFYWWIFAINYNSFICILSL